MADKVQSKCRCCGEIFDVDVRNRGAAKGLPESRLPSCRQSGAPAPLAREAREPGLLQRTGARRSGATVAGGPSGVLALPPAPGADCATRRPCVASSGKD